MKKLNPIFLVLFSIMLVACGSADFEEQNGASNPSPESPQIVSPNQNSDDAQLPAGMVSLNYSRLSFNYAQISWSASYVQSGFLRVPANYRVEGRGKNYIDVMIPLSDTNHAGSMKFHLPAKQNVFTIYYRDWANRLNKKDIKVTRS